MSLRDGLKPTGRKGVFYKEHETRKHGVRKDRQLVLRYTIAGTTRTETFGWTSEGLTEVDAEKKLAEFRANAKSGVRPTSLSDEREIGAGNRQAEDDAKKAALVEAEVEAAAERRRNTTVSEFFEVLYLPQAKHDKKPDTWGTEERLFRHWIAPVIGLLPFDQVSIEHLNEIKRNMAVGKRGDALPHPRDRVAGITNKSPQLVRNPARPMSAKTQQYAFAVIRQLWNMATAVKPPLAYGSWPGATRQFKKPKVENKRQRFLTREEAALLLARLKKSSRDVHDIALLALHCGMRAGEIFNLTWNRVNLNKGELLLVDTKNGESRIVYLTDQVLALLRSRAMDRTPGRHVFVNSKGGPFQQLPVTYARVVVELGFNKGITDRRDMVVFHTLRHTYASWLVEQGANIRLVGDLLGHKTLIMTTRYTHTTANAQREAVAKLSASLASVGENVVSIFDHKKV